MQRLRIIRPAIVFFLLLSPSTVPAQDISASLDSLAGRGTLLFRKPDGSFAQGKVTETSADSLFLGKGRSRKAIARADVEQVWRKEHTVLHSAILGAGLGAVGGAFLELSLGTCEGCGQVEDMLASAAVGAAGRAVEGAVVGWLGGNWKSLVPPAEGLTEDRRDPWEPWGASLRAGAVHRFNAYRDPNALSVGFTGWKNSRPGSSWGFDYGSLSHASGHSSYSISYGDSIFGSVRKYSYEVDGRSNWAYSGLVWRKRGAGPGLRGFVTTGLAGYLNRRIANSTVYDSSTAQTRHYSESRTELRTGISLGGGIATGRSDWRPALEVRGHWAFTEESLWITAQAGVDFH
jgi:hypothetical protein